MDELLYSIEILRDTSGYHGKLFNDTMGEIKEFHSNDVERLLRDITVEIELDFAVSSGQAKDDYEESD
jgi:hypothetical protein